MKNLYESFPDKINGWEINGPDKFYDRQTLYNYIDGGAELYLTYNFKQIFTRKYSKPKGGDILLDIYDMGKDAYGIFSIEREDEDIGIGRGSEFGGGLLRFWKGEYFISITSLSKDKNVKDAMRELAGKVAAELPDSQNEPDIISKLPKEGLQNNSIKFFHSHEILNRQYFFAEENILFLDSSTDCALAKYSVENKSCQIFIIKYPDGKASLRAKENFKKIYLPDSDENDIKKLENGKYTALKRDKNYLIMILDSPDKNLAISLLNLIKI